MPSGQDVRFIRRHGKIIPIKINREADSRKRAASLITAGVGVAVAGGLIGGGVLLGASKLATRAGNMLSNVNKVTKLPKHFRGISQYSAHRALKVGAKAAKSVSTRLALSGGIVRGSVGIGTGLITAGVLRGVSQEDRPVIEGTTAIASGLAAHGIATAAFRKLVMKKLKLP
jgi:hypothetical protein